GTEYQFGVAFSPASAGSVSAMFVIEHSAEFSPYEGSLNGTGSTELSISPGSYDFEKIEVGGDSDWFTFTVTNPTAANVRIMRVLITGTDSASFKSNPTGNVNFTVVKNGGAYEINVKFDPIKAGNMTAGLKVTLTTGSLTANLFGEGVTNPLFNITPQSHDFGSVILNSNILKVFTITNDGSAGLILSKIIIQDDLDSSFSISKGGVPTTIVPGNTHEIEIKFRPQTRGDKAASIRIEHNATNEDSPFYVGLQGKGSEISLQPSLYDFGNVNINPNPKPMQTFTVTNTSSDAITITDISIIGTNANEFKSNPSGSGSWVVNPGSGTFDIVVTCETTIEGLINAALQISISTGNPLSASLSANGVANPVFKINPTV
ncbi:MAG: choice-of-anchor D domain-containing protein, partial [Candidatus Heimdallarchaeota archaeon]|nr:choice-of-anchor D domain-containing protein [Candidatus Heimdallarchaeota archaeon]